MRRLQLRLDFDSVRHDTKESLRDGWEFGRSIKEVDLYKEVDLHYNHGRTKLVSRHCAVCTRPKVVERPSNRSRIVCVTIALRPIRGVKLKKC